MTYNDSCHWIAVLYEIIEAAKWLADIMLEMQKIVVEQVGLFQHEKHSSQM